MPAPRTPDGADPIKTRVVAFSAQLPGWLRLLLRQWYLLVMVAIVTYISSGISVLVQNGSQAFWNYLLSWALLKPVVDRYPVPFFVALAIALALAPIGRIIAKEEEVRELRELEQTVAGEAEKGKRRDRQIGEMQQVLGQHETGDRVLIIATGPLEGDALAAARSAYLQWVLETCDQVTLPIGLQSGEPLHVIFQPLELKGLKDAEIPENLTSGRLLFPWERPRIEDLPQRKEPDRPLALTGQDALQQSPNKRMIALGGPGAGKTTLLKHMAASDARAALDSAPDGAEPAPLPVFIRLADVARGKISIVAHLPVLLRAAGEAIDPRFTHVLEKALTEGTATLYLDGLDEVPPVARPYILQMIGLASRQFPATPIVVSSRFTDYQQDELERARFTPWALLPLDHHRRVLLAEHLLPLIGSEAVAVAPFVQAIETHQEASAWEESPLLFSLAAVIYIQNNGMLPLSRAGLYDEVIDAVLKIREPSPSERQTLRETLGECALIWLEQRGQLTFTLDNLLDTLKLVHRRTDATWDVDAMSERIKRSGVLETVAHNTYGFSHQTFREFFAAAALASHLYSHNSAKAAHAWKEAWAHEGVSRWRETLRLMVGVLTQQSAGEATHAALRWTGGLAGRWRVYRRRAYFLFGLLSALILLVIAAQFAALPALAVAAQRVPRELGSWWWLVGILFILIARVFTLLLDRRGRIRMSGGLAVVIEALSEIDNKAPFWRDAQAEAFGRHILTDWAKTLLFSFQHDLRDDELERLGRDIRQIGGPVGGVAVRWLEACEKREKRPAARRTIGRALAVARGEDISTSIPD